VELIARSGFSEKIQTLQMTIGEKSVMSHDRPGPGVAQMDGNWGSNDVWRI
jgi:hypothetical protein